MRRRRGGQVRDVSRHPVPDWSVRPTVPDWSVRPTVPSGPVSGCGSMSATAPGEDAGENCGPPIGSRVGSAATGFLLVHVSSQSCCGAREWFHPTTPLCEERENQVRFRGGRQRPRTSPRTPPGEILRRVHVVGLGVGGSHLDVHDRAQQGAKGDAVPRRTLDDRPPQRVGGKHRPRTAAALPTPTPRPQAAIRAARRPTGEGRRGDPRMVHGQHHDQCPRGDLAGRGPTCPRRCLQRGEPGGHPGGGSPAGRFLTGCKTPGGRVRGGPTTTVGSPATAASARSSRRPATDSPTRLVGPPSRCRRLLRPARSAPPEPAPGIVQVPGRVAPMKPDHRMGREHHVGAGLRRLDHLVVPGVDRDVVNGARIRSVVGVEDQISGL